jgi:hypothetical protein
MNDPSGAARGPAGEDEQRIDTLIERLPRRLQAPLQWLRRPSSRWARIPAGLLLIGGGLLGILPVFGLWMLPLGLILLSEDAAVMRRARGRVLDWLARRGPRLFHRQPASPRRRHGPVGGPVRDMRRYR